MRCDPRARLIGALLLFVPMFSHCREDVYTSVLSARRAVSVERALMERLKTYMDQEHRRLRDVQRFYDKVSQQHSSLSEGSAAALTNPLVAFTLIKRLHSDWGNLVYSNRALEHAEALRSAYAQEEEKLPELEDLQGAARALMRLEDVYALRVSGLVRGRFQEVMNGELVDVYRPAVSVRLSGDDCFHVGKVAYEQEDHYHSVQWMEQSVQLFRGAGRRWSPETQATLEDALDHLAFSHYKTGNISRALSLSQELLHHDPQNQRVLQNVKKYERLLEDAASPKAPGLRRPDSTHLRTRDAYERICRTHGNQALHYRNPALFCDYYDNNNNAALLLQPVRREVLSLRPFVVLYHQFVTDAEATDIKWVAEPGLRRSVVASGEKQVSADYRISQSAWLKDSAHPIVSTLDRRISALTGLNVKHPYSEYLQVVNYGIGGHYEPHFDHATSPSSPVYRLKSGNRVATFMMYLSSVEAGGSTAFIYANFSVPVEKGAAIFWWNLKRNGDGDLDALHAGCPVLVGDKWVANKWIHEFSQEFQHPCGLNPDD